MAQAATTCAHNAPSQTIRSDYPVPCRKCGALIQATSRAVSTSGLVKSEKAVNAVYPGDSKTADQAWAFGL